MRSKPFLGTVSSFRDAFPGVKTLKLLGRQRGDVSGDHQREERYTELNLPQTIPCSNPRCKQGGYDLMAYLITLAHDRTPSYNGQVYCNGHEGTPRGMRKGDPCWNALTFSTTASFHSDERGSRQ
jgi:hypothetical protein